MNTLLTFVPTTLIPAVKNFTSLGDVPISNEGIYTIALLVVTSGMTIIAGILAHLYRQRDGQFEAAAKRVNQLTTLLEREELLTKRLDENGKKSEETADYYKYRCAQLTEEIDVLRSTVKEYETALATAEATVKGLTETQAQLERLASDTIKQVNEWKLLSSEQAKTIDLLKAERATLYRRNEKGQIEPITPKPRKPHTLKHGMTVKDPTPAQAKRIFREAKRAGLTHSDVVSETFPWIYFSEDDVVSSLISEQNEYDTYITATEFIKRIKGEVA